MATNSSPKLPDHKANAYGGKVAENKQPVSKTPGKAG